MADDVHLAETWAFLDTPAKLWTYGFLLLLEFAAAAEAAGIETEQVKDTVMAATMGLEARAAELGDG